MRLLRSPGPRRGDYSAPPYHLAGFKEREERGGAGRGEEVVSDV